MKLLKISNCSKKAFAGKESRASARKIQSRHVMRLTARLSVLLLIQVYTLAMMSVREDLHIITIIYCKFIIESDIP